jgi:hypothetical protein
MLRLVRPTGTGPRSLRRPCRAAALGLAAASLIGASPAHAAPEGVLSPTLTCIDVGENGEITAHFGYSNTWHNDVTIPAGHRRNSFGPAPADRGQPSRFSPGTYDDVFTVTFTGPSLTWQLGDDDGIGVATATVDSRRCTSVPAMGLDSPWPVLLAGVGLGVAFALRRRSTARAGA